MHKMKMKTMVAAALCGCLLAGCVSEAVRREYAEWQKSDDAVASVSAGEFESRYMNGWRERAQEKRSKRLAREEYRQWLVSDDAVKDTSYQEFQSKYKTGWRERAEQKKQIRLAKEAKERAEHAAREARERAEREAREAKEREIARQKAAAAELRRQRDERIAKNASAYLKAIRARYADGKNVVRESKRTIAEVNAPVLPIM